MRSVRVLRCRAGRVARGVSRVFLALALVLAGGASARAQELAAPEPKPDAPEPKLAAPAPKPIDTSLEERTPEGRPFFDTPSSVELHGFVSQGFILSSGNNYLAESKKGSFEFNEAGINLNKALGDRLRVGIQFFARDLGAVGNYVPKLDWFNLDYRLADWLGIRAGRLKTPFGLYNEVNDVDSARVPVLLPQ